MEIDLKPIRERLAAYDKLPGEDNPAKSYRQLIKVGVKPACASLAAHAPRDLSRMAMEIELLRDMVKRRQETINMVRKMPNCDTCDAANRCNHYRKSGGKDTRFNCPLWIRKENKDNEWRF